ncbi:MAG: hypothetical protein IJ645_08950 [Ruminococcus sp.]|nr:hypothetical protein [Ruminococcus sp.]
MPARTAEELQNLSKLEFEAIFNGAKAEIKFYIEDNDYKSLAKYISDVIAVSGDPKKSPEALAVYTFFEELSKPEPDEYEASEEDVSIILGLNKAFMQQRAIAQVSTGKLIKKWEKKIRNGEIPELVEYTNDTELVHAAAKDLVFANELKAKTLVGNFGAYESFCAHMANVEFDGKKLSEQMNIEAQYIKADAKRRYLQNGINEKDYQQYLEDTSSALPALSGTEFEVKKNRSEGSYFSKVPKKVGLVAGKSSEQILGTERMLTNKLSSLIDYNNSVKEMADEAVLLTEELNELNAQTGNNGTLTDMRNAVLAVSSLGKSYYDKETGKNTAVIKDAFVLEALERLRVAAESYARQYKRDKTPAGKKNLEFAVRMQNLVISKKERLLRQSAWMDEPEMKNADIQTVSAELTEQLKYIDNEKDRRGLEKGFKGVMKKLYVRNISAQGFADIVSRGNAAKAGVWNGSKKYDDALNAFEAVGKAYDKLQALKEDPFSTPEQKLGAIGDVRNAIAEAGAGIDLYFERKREQNKLQTGATYDLKSQRRIDLMKDAKNYLADCETVMKLEEQQIALESVEKERETEPVSEPKRDLTEAEKTQNSIKQNCENSKGQYNMIARRALVSVVHLGALTIAAESNAELTQKERNEADLNIAEVVYYELAFDGVKFKDTQSEKVDKKFYDEQIKALMGSEPFKKVTKDLDRKGIADIAADPKKIAAAYRNELGGKKKDMTFTKNKGGPVK